MGGEGVTQMIANDHRGEGGGVWEGPKYDRAILEQPLKNVDQELRTSTVGIPTQQIFARQSKLQKYIESRA